MRNPTWLDILVQQEIDKKDSAEDIAKVVATSPKFVQAIKDGIATTIPPGVMGLSKAQLISDAILNSLKDSM